VPEATLLAMMEGFVAGLQRGDAPLSAEDAWAEARIVERPRFERSDSFNLDTDLHVLRAFQHCSVVDGAFVLDQAYADERHNQILRSVFGSEYLDIAMFAIKGSTVQDFMQCLRLNPDQTVTIDETALTTWWQSLERRVHMAITDGTPHHEHRLDVGLLQERLRTVRCVGVMQVVESDQFKEITTPQSWHQQVVRLAGSTVLRTLMSPETTDSLERELAGIFSPAEATAHDVNEAVRRAAQALSADSIEGLNAAEQLLLEMRKQQGPVDDLTAALRDEAAEVIRRVAGTSVIDSDGTPLSVVEMRMARNERLVATYREWLRRLQKYTA